MKEEMCLKGAVIGRNCRVYILGMVLATLFLAACYNGGEAVTDRNANESGQMTVSGEKASAEALLLHTADHSGKYCYGQLTDTEKLWYADMYAIMDGMYTNTALSRQGNTEIGEEGIDKVFQCVMNDYPDFFYVKGYTYTVYTRGNRIDKITFSGTYTMEEAEREQKQALIDEAVTKALAGIAPQASDYEKIKYVYEYIVRNTNYNMDAADNQNICSVFIGGESVCQGYAKATQYLLEKLGIPATLVVGRVYGTESHAWNLVFADGAYYYVDTTWGDASYRMEEENATEEIRLPEISYDYLCVTTQKLLQTHSIDNVVDLPLCDSMQDNYYVREGAYFTAYDEHALRTLFEESEESGKGEVTLQCADSEVFTICLQELITNQKIFGFLNSPDRTIAYTADADKLSMTFWLVNE